MVAQDQPQAALTPDSALEYLSRLGVPSPNSDSPFLWTKYRKTWFVGLLTWSHSSCFS